MYSWECMYKITYTEALNRFRCNLSVYLLYDDDTESLAEDESAIDKHYRNCGEYGFEKDST